MMELGIPGSPSALTADWFSACLTQAGVLSRGRISEIRVERFGSGVGLLGLVVRVHLEYAEEGGAPREEGGQFPRL